MAEPLKPGTPVERVTEPLEPGAKPRFREGTKGVIVAALNPEAPEGSRGYDVRLIEEGRVAFWSDQYLRVREATVADLMEGDREAVRSKGSAA